MECEQCAISNERLPNCALLMAQYSSLIAHCSLLIAYGFSFGAADFASGFHGFALAGALGLTPKSHT
jgi:hypothetical protein